MTRNEYPAGLIELLEFLAADSANGCQATMARIPERLRGWAAIGQRDGLVGHVFVLLTDLGRAVLEMHRLESADEPVTADADEQAEPPGMTWQEAAERLENLRKQGAPYTSLQELADDINSTTANAKTTKSTVNKAIISSPMLRSWQKSKPGASPRAVSFNPDNPEVAAAEFLRARATAANARSEGLDVIRERIEAFADKERLFLEKASGELRAAYYELPEAARGQFLNDPELLDELRRPNARGSRLLGRKP